MLETSSEKIDSHTKDTQANRTIHLPGNMQVDATVHAPVRAWSMFLPRELAFCHRRLAKTWSVPFARQWGLFR
jgi:hypothetical protein